MPGRVSAADPAALAARYKRVRGLTERLCGPLAVEDYGLQSMPECSPPKWHLAHTTWFFETFVLADHEPGFRPYHPLFRVLFNSYYEAVGDRWPRPDRGLLSRPTVADVYAYRRAIDERIVNLIERVTEALAPLVELGLNHEQQHQELLITDLKHAFGLNPLRPEYSLTDFPPGGRGSTPPRWEGHPAGVRWVGHAGGGFAFDNEAPRHRAFVEGFRIASRPETAGEYLAFVEDGGYARPEFWLSDGWAARQAKGWTAPLYWERTPDGWSVFTLGGQRPLDPAEPVCHVSYYEADAFARWAGARLPTEAEWETAVEGRGMAGNFLDSGRLHPTADSGTGQWYGDVWEWTASPYTAYPGYRPAAGALGEYNGKFMCNQLVLRGGSCATPAGHVGPTYRNFFPPDARWQFSGLRLAKDLRMTTATAPRPAPPARFRADVLAGLSRPQKRLPAKYFYDAAGSELFDRITGLDEYYLTRTELGIMRRHAGAMAARCGPRCLLIELGAGSLLKVRLLLDRLDRPAGYVPVDVSGDHLRAAAAELARDYPALPVVPVCADFTREFPLPAAPTARRVAYFPGSTIGNFDPPDADDLLRRVARLVGPGGGLLLGADLQKPAAVLEAAYNDRAGLTASFNKNILVRINRELGADFDPDAFGHLAFFDPERSRVEMHLVSRAGQRVRIGDAVIVFRVGETIHTENSYKYTPAGLGRQLARCGFRTKKMWTDEKQYFTVLSAALPG